MTALVNGVYELQSFLVYRVESDASLSIHNVSKEDAGIYECTAQNTVGYATVTARVTVEGKIYTQFMSYDNNMWYMMAELVTASICVVSRMIMLLSVPFF